MQIFTCPFTLTIDTKNLTFKHKYIFKILPTKSFLHKYCSVSFSPCRFCFMTKVPISHNFVMGIVQGFLGRTLQVLRRRKRSINIDLSFNQILFVLTYTQVLMEEINMLLLTLFHF